MNEVVSLKFDKACKFDSVNYIILSRFEGANCHIDAAVVTRRSRQSNVTRTEYKRRCDKSSAQKIQLRQVRYDT